MTRRALLAGWVALAACSGTDKPPEVCVEGADQPDAWEPAWEADVRVDEATATWAATGEGTVGTDCGGEPCLALTGPVAASADFTANRGLGHVLTGTVVSDVPVDVVVAWLEADGAEREVFTQALDAGTTELEVPFAVQRARDTLRITFTLTEPGAATLDGFAITSTRWARTDAAPTGPVRLGFLVHVEDEAEFIVDEAAWRRRARVLEGLSATLAARGARLGIQADASFVRGATTWDPAWVDARTAEGAGWSVHIHDESDPAHVEPAIRDGRAALAAAGVEATDLNGGFATAIWGRAADAGLLSLTAYKDPATQTGLPRVQIEPWRPADGAGADDPEHFLLHLDSGPLVYLPGHDIREVEHTRFPTFAEAVLSQVLAHARPDAVSTWYFVLHVDGFGPGADTEAYDAYLDGAFADDLAHYGAFLDALEPLVEAGFIAYDTPDGMRRAWRTAHGCDD